MGRALSSRRDGAARVSPAVRGGRSRADEGRARARHGPAAAAPGFAALAASASLRRVRLRSFLHLLAGNAAAKALTFLAGSVVLAWLFGADGGTDALLVAQILPGFLVYFLSYSTQSALVPVLAEVRVRRGEEETRRIAGGVFWAAVVLAAAVGAGLSAASGLYLPVFGPGFAPDQADLSVRLASILLAALPFHAAAAVGQALLVSAGRTGAAGACLAVGPAVQLAAMVALHRALGIEAAAWATLIGPIAQTAVVLPLLARASALRFGAPRFADPAVARVGRLMIPGAVGAATYAVYLAVFRGAGTLLPDGSLTSLDYAEKLAQGLPLLAVGSVGTVLLPELSALAARGERPAMGAALRRAGELLAAWVAPVAVALALYGEDVCALVFGHGRFPPDKIGETALALLVLAPRTAALGLGQVVDQGLFSLQRPRDSFVASLTGLVVGLACALFLAPRFGIAALAAGQTGAFLTQTAVGMAFLSRAMEGHLPASGLLVGHLRPLAVAAGAGLVGLAAGLAVPESPAARLLVEGGVAAGLYLLVAPRLGVPALARPRAGAPTTGPAGR